MSNYNEITDEGKLNARFSIMSVQKNNTLDTNASSDYNFPRSLRFVQEEDVILVTPHFLSFMNNLYNIKENNAFIFTFQVDEGAVQLFSFSLPAGFYTITDLTNTLNRLCDIHSFILLPNTGFEITQFVFDAVSSKLSMQIYRRNGTSYLTSFGIYVTYLSKRYHHMMGGITNISENQFVNPFSYMFPTFPSLGTTESVLVSFPYQVNVIPVQTLGVQMDGASIPHFISDSVSDELVSSNVLMVVPVESFFGQVQTTYNTAGDAYILQTPPAGVFSIRIVDMITRQPIQDPNFIYTFSFSLRIVPNPALHSVSYQHSREHEEPHAYIGRAPPPLSKHLFFSTNKKQKTGQ